MDSMIRRESRRFHCPEEGRDANLIVEWRKSNGDEVIHRGTMSYFKTKTKSCKHTVDGT